MIDEADDSLAAMLGAADLGPGTCEIAFDPPTPEWAAKHASGKALNLFLHDITEQLESRVADWTDVRDGNGRIVERQPPLRRYDLSYLVSAWTGSVKGDHQLLSAALRCFAHTPSIPAAHRAGSLGVLQYPLPLQVAIPGAGPAADVWDIWSALGTPPRAYLKLVVCVPLRLPVDRDIAPEITARKIAVGTDDGSVEDVTSPDRDERAGAQNEARLRQDGDDAAQGSRAGRRRVLTEVPKKS